MKSWKRVAIECHLNVLEFNQKLISSSAMLNALRERIRVLEMRLGSNEVETGSLSFSISPLQLSPIEKLSPSEWVSDLGSGGEEEETSDDATEMFDSSVPKHEVLDSTCAKDKRDVKKKRLSGSEVNRGEGGEVSLGDVSSVSPVKVAHRESVNSVGSPVFEGGRFSGGGVVQQPTCYNDYLAIQETYGKAYDHVDLLALNALQQQQLRGFGGGGGGGQSYVHQQQQQTPVTSQFVHMRASQNTQSHHQVVNEQRSVVTQQQQQQSISERYRENRSLADKLRSTLEYHEEKVGGVGGQVVMGSLSSSPSCLSSGGSAGGGSSPGSTVSRGVSAGQRGSQNPMEWSNEQVILNIIYICYGNHGNLLL